MLSLGAVSAIDREVAEQGRGFQGGRSGHGLVVRPGDRRDGRHRVVRLPRAGIAALTPEGLFVLCYLLTAGASPGLTQPGRWRRHQVRLGVAGVIASGAVLAALALHQANSAWLTVAGLAAAAAAYLIALPRPRA